jgi:quinol monooxygenase YgiN
MTDMIQVIVFYFLKETSKNIFTDAFKTLRPKVLEEEGCLQYELFVSPYEATRFCLVEKWLSQAALDKHLGTKNLSGFRLQSEPWFEKKPIIEIKTIENERHA